MLNLHMLMLKYFKILGEGKKWANIEIRNNKIKQF